MVFDGNVFDVSVCDNTFCGILTYSPFHRRDFKHTIYRNSTELLKYIWELKDTNISSAIEWSIVTKASSKTQLNVCKLCLSEKFYIIKSLNGPNLLNKKSELANTCRHQSKLLLESFKKNRYSERSDTMD